MYVYEDETASKTPSVSETKQNETASFAGAGLADKDAKVAAKKNSDEMIKKIIERDSKFKFK